MTSFSEYIKTFNIKLQEKCNPSRVFCDVTSTLTDVHERTWHTSVVGVHFFFIFFFFFFFFFSFLFFFIFVVVVVAVWHQKKKRKVIPTVRSYAFSILYSDYGTVPLCCIVFMFITCRTTDEPVWPSGKALDWYAKGPWFDSVLDFVWLLRLWFEDTHCLYDFAPHKQWNVKMALIAAHLNTGDVHSCPPQMKIGPC